MKSVTVVTHIITPYQVELFDAVRANGALDLRVIYLADSRPHRSWQLPALAHPAIELALCDAAGRARAEAWIADSHLTVIGHYRHGEALRWIDQRNRRGAAWCFWGERPGFRFGGLTGRAYRSWKLRSLLKSKAPVWGIGSWAVEGWRREFGDTRRYFNVPYFSNLDRFAAASRRSRRNEAARRILFSGSLIARKGVDLLADAFVAICAKRPGLTLQLVGDGDLRPQLERTLHKVSDRVAFTGFQQWEDLPRHYADADVLCVPSRYDGWGLVIPEGLAAGLPVIATRKMGAAVDLVRPAENGWLAQAADGPSLQASLEAAADATDDELARMSDSARRSVGSHQLGDGVRCFEEAVEGTLAVWPTVSDPTSAGRETVTMFP